VEDSGEAVIKYRGRVVMAVAGEKSPKVEVVAKYKFDPDKFCRYCKKQRHTLDQCNKKATKGSKRILKTLRRRQQQPLVILPKNSYQ
jgi:hypothetical protein